MKHHDEVIGSGKIEEALQDRRDRVETTQTEEQLGIAFNNIKDTETRLRDELTSDDAMGRVDNVLDFANRLDDMHHTEDRWRNLGVDTDRGYRLNSTKVVYGEINRVWRKL